MPVDMTKVNGVVQKLIVKALMEMSEEQYSTPLIQEALGQVQMNIPQNSGNLIEWRKFSDLAIPTTTATTGTDNIKTYLPNVDATVAKDFTSAVYQCAPTFFKDLIGPIDKFTSETDAIDLVQVATRKIGIQQKQMAESYVTEVLHCGVQSHFLTDATIPADQKPNMNLCLPFDFLLAGNAVDFAALNPQSVITMADFVRAAQELEIRRVPKINGCYNAVINPWVKMQLMQDPEFVKAIEHWESTSKDAKVKGVLGEFGMCRWITTDFPFRTKSAAEGNTGAGAALKRYNVGSLFSCPVFGNEAYGFLTLWNRKIKAEAGGQDRTVKGASSAISLKIQDLSNTGTGPSIGWSMPFQATPVDQRRGISVLGAVSAAVIAQGNRLVGPAVLLA